MPRRASSSTTGWWTSARIRSTNASSISGHRRVGAHPAGVRAGVAVADPLEVARRRERQRGLAVADREQRQLVAVEELLDHHRRVAEPPRDQHLLQRRAGLRLVGGDHHALARGEAVGLDDDRVAGDRGEPLCHRSRRRRGRRSAPRRPPSPPSRTPSIPRAGRRPPTARNRRRRPPHRRPRARDERDLGADDDEVDPRRRGRSASPAGLSGSAPSSTRASRAIPALPGAHSTSGRCGERASARTIACSRPPAPTTRTAVTEPR